MKFAIRNRWSGEVQFEAEIEASDDTPLSVKVGLAVKWGMKSGADLSGADLSGAYLFGANLSDAHLSRANLSRANLSRANLSRANLSGANLSGANLSGANLSGADLSGADLSGADLSGADLSGAYLFGADLSGADLSGANLSGAYLFGADLSGADLSGADLSGADLSGAYLSRAKWRDGIIINKIPVQISGLTYPITILDAHMQIGCELHSLAEWSAFDDARIAAMDGTRAARFWRDHKDGLLAMARGAGRSFDPMPVKSEAA